jgi:hypothetical protein
MSFILDALKKSESDRQRQSGPSLFEVKVAPPRRSLPVWAVIVAALLVINVIVISWMLLRHPTTQQPSASTPAPTEAPPPSIAASRAIGQGTAPARNPVPPSVSAAGSAGAAADAAPPPAAPAAEQASAHVPSQRQSAAAAPPAGGAGQSAGAATPAGAGGGEPSDVEPADTAPAVEPGAVQGSGAAQGAAGDLPLYRQVVSSAGLPELHLDLHVFAARPQDRFVMINMHRLGEGDSLPNGARVEAIRPDGVVLSYHGTRFLLPRN